MIFRPWEFMNTVKSFVTMMVGDKRHIKPLLVRFGVALALSFAGFLYSRLRNKMVKPYLPPVSPRSSDHRTEVDDSGANAWQSNDLHSPKTISGSGHVVSVASERFGEEIHIQRSSVDNSMIGLSPSSRHSGDGYLLPEFNNLVKEFDFASTTSGLSPRKGGETPRSDIATPKAFKSAEKDEYDYEQEIKDLRNVVRTLRERERNLEVQLLEYYGLKEQETAVLELQNRLKINNMEAKLFMIKIESLQADKQKLEAQAADQAKIASELEAAKSKIKFLKKKLRHEAEQNQEQLLNLQKRVAWLQEHELKATASDQDIQFKLQRLKVLEGEADELRKSNKRLQIENSELARRLDSTQILANSVLEDPETEALKEMSNCLRQENEELQKEIERLQADRCADVEELVYLRWINACLRYELRNFQAPPGKTVARDLSKSLSPRSESKAKKLILEYANVDEIGERGVSITDTDFDDCSSSHTSYVTDSGDLDDTSVDNSTLTRTNSSSKTKFLSKLRNLIRGKGSGRQSYSQCSSAGKIDPPEDIEFHSRSPSVGIETVSYHQSNSCRFPSPQIPPSISLNDKRSRSLSMDDVKDVKNVERNSDMSSSYAYKRLDDVPDLAHYSQLDQHSDSIQIPDLVKFAEVLQNNRPPKGKHKRSSSFV
ncbi:hypothetical protein SLEP1_g36402 [Rubroshorea leprosula]|nr:hypothetical protein SLEP1_g36402 [Rubroshorea leprosula]